MMNGKVFDRRDFTILPNYWQKIITFSREEHGPVATGGRERSFIQVIFVHPASFRETIRSTALGMSRLLL